MYQPATRTHCRATRCGWSSAHSRAPTHNFRRHRVQPELRNRNGWHRLPARRVPPLSGLAMPHNFSPRGRALTGGLVARSTRRFRRTCFGVRVNPNSEIELAGRAAARGAHAAGVPFSAARRKPRTTHFFGRRRKLERGHEGLGGPPNPARGPRALPISISEFGMKSSPTAKS